MNADSGTATRERADMLITLESIRKQINTVESEMRGSTRLATERSKEDLELLLDKRR